MVFVILTVAVTLLTVPAALAQYNTPIPPGGNPGVDLNPGTPGTPGTPGAPNPGGPGAPGGSVGGPGGGGGTGVVPGGSGSETPVVVREEVVERPQGAGEGEGGGEGRENTGRRRNRGGNGRNLPLTGADIVGLTALAAGTIAIGTMLTVKNRRRSLPG